MRKLFHLPSRNIDIGTLQDTFLVCAVATILVIRTQLWLTNYPQLGGRGLHIAHLLWGGLLMLIAIGLALSFLGRSIRRAAAIVGGIGFGFFIDEVGKFITSDNNYFFKPAAGVIYVTFIVLFLVSRQLQTRRGFSAREYLMNTIDLFMDAARHDLDASEKQRALAALNRADQKDPLVQPLRQMIQATDALPPREPSRLERFAWSVRDRYFKIIDRRWFINLVTWVYTIWAIGTLGRVLEVLAGDEAVSFINTCGAISSGVAGAFVLVGVVYFRRKRRFQAYAWFERAIFVQLFITYVFEFVESQFTAAFGLLVTVVLLISVRYMMRREMQLEREQESAGSKSSMLAPGPA